MELYGLVSVSQLSWMRREIPLELTGSHYGNIFPENTVQLMQYW